MNKDTLISKIDAFSAAYEFLQRYYEEEESDELRILVSGMNGKVPELPSDANTLYSWAECIANARGIPVDTCIRKDDHTHPSASAEEWFSVLENYMVYFEGLLRGWGTDRLNSILSDLRTVDFSNTKELSNNPIWADWLYRCAIASGRTS